MGHVEMIKERSFINEPFNVFSSALQPDIKQIGGEKDLGVKGNKITKKLRKITQEIDGTKDLPGFES